MKPGQSVDIFVDTLYDSNGVPSFESSLTIKLAEDGRIFLSALDGEGKPKVTFEVNKVTLTKLRDSLTEVLVILDNQIDI